MMGRLAEGALYSSLASPGTKTCDAVGGTFRPEWREGPVRTILRGLDALIQRAVHSWIHAA
jgi:hypothetical protein